MSDILIILVALGVLILVGVVFFNWWQERKYRNRISSDFKPTKRDVLIEDFQINTDLLRQERMRTSGTSKQEPNASDLKLNIHEHKKEPRFAPEKMEDDDKPQVFQEALALEESHSEIDDTIAYEEPAKIEVVEILAPSERKNALEEQDSHVESQDLSHLVNEISLPEVMHPQIDLIAILYAAAPILHTKVSDLEGQFKEYTENTLVYGLTTNNDWIALNHNSLETSYTQLAFSMQLADRGGAVSRAVLNRFQHAVETIGLDLGAHVEWQGAGDALANAQTLDQFCIEVDKTVGFHLLADNSASFHATKFRGLAEAQGFSLAQDGRFHMYHHAHPNQIEYAVKNYEGNAFSTEMLKNSVMNGVTFQLDIPTVKNSADVFDRMIVTAKSMANSLSATIVDDNRKELGDIQLEKIRQQLKIINATMIAKGIIPGSSHALRLFS